MPNNYQIIELIFHISFLFSVTKFISIDLNKTIFFQKTITENPEILKEAYIQTCAKDISTSIKSKFDDDYSSNKHINGLNENIFLIQKSILIPMHIEKNNLWYNKYSTIHNENNIHRNEKETYLTINTESLLCLQNYLLFSCARDCSILMSFREINP